MTADKPGRPLLALILAIALLAALSLLPWSRWTGGVLKDFSLISDLVPVAVDSAVGVATDNVDPMLRAEMLSVADSAEVRQDSTARDTLSAYPTDGNVDEYYNPRVDGNLPLEDFTASGEGLAHLRAALERCRSRVARIAVVGDSYIEGDIFTLDLRDALQSEFGGRGVGFMAAHSEIPGFRRSVLQSSGGWEEHDVRKPSHFRHKALSGHYFTGNVGSTVNYKGIKSNPRLAAWSSSRLLFIAPAPGAITLTTDGETRRCEVTGVADSVQQILLQGETTRLKIENQVPGLVFLGAWLEDGNGVSVDCMSVRGVSGITHRATDVALAREMARFVDYDLIIVEYGINALTASQNDYSAYGRLMAKSLRRLRECYPGADILMMGVGDRGLKVGGEVHSMPTVNAMVRAQRQAAKDAGVLFWDTREAMGGPDAIVDWRERHLINADYIHLNSAGGKALAQELMKSIKMALR